MDKRKIIFLVLIIFIVVLLTRMTIFIIEVRTPVKYAIKINDVEKYPNAILVKQTWITGTGWEQVGDDEGMYTNKEDVHEVQLVGNIPPSVEMVGMGVDHVNTFLCEVEPDGTFQIPGTNSPVHLYAQFKVIEWHPIYPVKRETILPKFLYSDDYLSYHDLNK